MIAIPAFSHAPIDIHSHFNHGSPYDCPETIPFDLHNRSLSFIKNAYDHIGVCAAGMSTYASVLEYPACIPEENLYLRELVRETEWMYQWVVIDPYHPDTYAQAAELLREKKPLGIKINPVSHRYDIEDHAEALFSFAAEHCTVLLMHPQKIEKMPFWADRFPEMRLIIAHLGSMEYLRAIENAQYGNIYADTSGSASNLNNGLEYAVSRVGADKILFGTDTYSCAFQFGRIALSALKLEEKEKILFGNAMKLFPKAFQEC